jgi:hypothetical protein
VHEALRRPGKIAHRNRLMETASGVCNCLAICKTGVEEIHYAGLLTTKLLDSKFFEHPGRIRIRECDFQFPGLCREDCKNAITFPGESKIENMMQRE